ncbi:hypothetical protein [Peptoniphilus sp. oral taxon 386]|uniref:hypothetical protein n=1 Tax=Peptoniphilus sp. oral taxon 386 TaxID=652713 RepID=UPI0001DA9AE7|nr:hypothetical protein [Peptoniphilus sp. oral taxon 386]EFI42049.1 hypothetical protein HMPREF0629_00683 [Peptoniphilus sp. oral taxon 386 str. F0131]
MRKNGYTYLITILVIAVIVIAISYMIGIFNNNLIIYKNERDSIQSGMYAESMINISISDYDKLKEVCRKIYYDGKNDFLNIKPEYTVDDIEIKKLEICNDSTFSKNGFLITSVIEYNGIEESCFAKGEIVNSLFTMGKSILNPRILEGDEINNLKETEIDFNDANKSIARVIEISQDCYMKKDGLNIIIYTEEIEETEFGKTVKENILHKYSCYDDIYLKQIGGTVAIEDVVKIYGIVELSSVYLYKDIEIQGILNLKGNINYIDSKAQINVKGITINTCGNSENNLNSEYDFDLVNRYSEHIKNFIRPKINTIQKSLPEI